MRPDALICLPTGSTPTRLYELLALEKAKNPDLFMRFRVVQLDEWVRAGPCFRGSCRAYLQEKVLAPLDVSSDRFFGFDSETSDPEAECRRMAQWLGEQGPIDLCVLGLGLSGHVGFNEPGSDPDGGPHVATLAQETLRHSMAVGADLAQLAGVTLGLRDILASRRILFLVSGAGKQEVFRCCVRGPVSSACPASFLRLHPSVDALYDASALQP